MPLEALLLALAAAALHAFWNLVLARSRDVEAATAVVLGLSLVFYAPVAALTWRVEDDVWPYVAASAAFELAYVLLLAAAYARAELSVVYPIARGGAPVLVLAVGALALGQSTTRREALGVILVALGVLLVRGLARPEGGGVAFGLAIAASIAGYTLVDARGIEHASPFAYLELVMALPVAVLLARAASARGVAALRRELGLATVVAGVACFGAFALALAALRIGSAASVAAVRETSVVIAVALAAPVLKERVGALRLAGATLVAAGVATLAA